MRADDWFAATGWGCWGWRGGWERRDGWKVDIEGDRGGERALPKGAKLEGVRGSVETRRFGAGIEGGMVAEWRFVSVLIHKYSWYLLEKCTELLELLRN